LRLIVINLNKMLRNIIICGLCGITGIVKGQSLNDTSKNHIEYLAEISLVGQQSKRDVLPSPEIIGTKVNAGKKNAIIILDNLNTIVVNNNNFSLGEQGKPTLLSLDDARTLFHEFGHGLHGLLSQVKYPRLSGTSVLRDFVEFPSQVYENWLMQPQILKEFALHAETGQPMPNELIEKILAAQTFNQGFTTVEYVSCALVDLALHENTDLEKLDFQEFETQSLNAIQMPPAIGMRHRLPHFSHLFSSNGYASAYYVYMWAEVLDADGFDAFLEAGDLFAAEPAQKLYEHIYSAGNRQDPMEAYIAFRGREPTVTPLLTKRGLMA